MDHLCIKYGHWKYISCLKRYLDIADNVDTVVSKDNVTPLTFDTVDSVNTDHKLIDSVVI